MGRVLQAAALVLIALFWARTLYVQWPHLRAYPWRFSWPYLGLALALLLTQMLMLAIAWWQALSVMGAPLPWWAGVSMWLRAQMARYLPGGMWDIAGRVVLSRRLDMPTRAIPAAAALEIGLQLVSATIILVLTLFLLPNAQTRGLLPSALGGMALLLIFLSPPVFHRVMNLGLRTLGRSPLPIRLNAGHLARLFSLYALAHVAQGSAFFLFIRGIAPRPWAQAPLLVGGYVAAWLVGYVAVFAPTGIGVREAALVYLLGNRLPAAALIAGALGFRVWLSMRDVLAALVGIGLATGHGPEEEQRP